MRLFTIVFAASAAAALGQTGQIAGIVTDDGGAPIAGAMVSASMRSSPSPVPPTPGKPPTFMPIRANAASGVKGEFQIDGLPAGAYDLCVETPGGAYLNPCLWSDQPVRVQVAVGARVSGATVVAAKGAIVTVRVQDYQGLLAANPGNDDLRIGTYHGKSPFIPARASGRDANGKTMSLVVPRGRGVDIAVSSAGFSLADDKGKTLDASETKIPVPSSAIPSTPPGVGAPTPTVTVQVTGKKGK